MRHSQIFNFQWGGFSQNDDYGFLLVNYKSIAKILTQKLEALQNLSFDSASSFLFGFSFGARLITKAAIDYGPQQIGTIHCKQLLCVCVRACVRYV